MKKIIVTLFALVGTMSMNAQIIEVMKNGQDSPVETYNGSDYYVVFKYATTGTAKATIGSSEVDVNWVQLWKDGPKFAEYNVGAANNKAEDYGGYYCWGSSIDKDSNGAYKSGTDALTGDSDTATKLWGSNWRMPTQAELQALLANCDAQWTTVGGVSGRKFTGKGDYSSNSVFLPVAGYCYRGSVRDQGSNGYYWSSTALGSKNAVNLYFGSGNQHMDSFMRYDGSSVRAVLAE